MPPRPYIQMQIDQLLALFDENQDNIKILKVLIEELQHRNKPKAIKLRAKVEERLNLIKIGDAIKPTTESSQNASDPPEKPQPNKACHAQHPLKEGSPHRQVSFFETISKSKQSDDKEGNPIPNEESSSTISVESVDPDADRPFDAIKGVIRAKGKLPGVPDKRIFKQKNNVTLDLTDDAPLAKRYEATLKALISDMRKNNAAARQISLENGHSVSLDGKENGYQFAYGEAEDLFEGAAVVANIGGIHSDGRIVAVGGRQIIICLSDDFGPCIPVCILKVDNTAMIEALRVRLEKIANGDIPEFNAKMAEAVLRNEGEEITPEAMPAQSNVKLNTKQRVAIEHALSNEVTYLWGPPGTGKTQTLSTLCLSLVKEHKRILICSNTNQAVDQVLLKVCKEFKATDSGRQALDDGSVIRVGKIAHAELEGEWSQYVTLDGIVDRKSASLRERMAVLEEHLEKINKSFERAIEVNKLFKELDRLVASEVKARNDHDKAFDAITKGLKEKKSKTDKLNELEEQIRAYQQAGNVKRVFLTKPEINQKKIEVIRQAIERLISAIESAEQTVQAQKIILNDIEPLLIETRQKLAGFDRDIIEKQIEDSDKQKQPILEEITDINKQLTDIRKAIVDNALIVGATVTKAYLSPQMFANFDTVIIDEASMVLLPAIYHSAGLAKEKVVVSGDFLQLAPIVTTDQKAILDEIGTNVFHAAKVNDPKNTSIKRLIMLEEQYRMDDGICSLISNLMYGGRLITGSRDFQNPPPTPPKPFDATLTIVDTSPVCPFVNRDPFGSRFNLMNALAIRNICLHFAEQGYLIDNKRVGVCTPYSAQTKVTKRILAEHKLDSIVEAGTVHRYQGDEKEVMVLDIPDSYGESRVGMFLEADNPNETGAMLFNVAVSRAKSNLIVFANLRYLDMKLPAYSVLRDILFNMQSRGSVIDVRDVLALYPVMNDLRKYGTAFDLSPDAESTGLFRQSDFELVCQADMARARKGIAIYSGFITPQRVGTYEGLFLTKIADGVSVRCVSRPPNRNGSIPVDEGRAALDGLEQMGCVVDTRGDIHEKAVIIDDEILWFGSLNPLSHTSKTSEVMARVEGRQLVSQFVTFMSLDKGARVENADGLAYRAENPRCPLCESRVSFKKGRYGAFWDCENEACTWKESFDKPKYTKNGTSSNQPTGAKCPECGNQLIEKAGKFGTFIGCSGYPKCGYIEKPKKKSTTSRSKRK